MLGGWPPGKPGAGREARGDQQRGTHGVLDGDDLAVGGVLGTVEDLSAQLLDQLSGGRRVLHTEVHAPVGRNRLRQPGGGIHDSGATVVVSAERGVAEIVGIAHHTHVPVKGVAVEVQGGLVGAGEELVPARGADLVGGAIARHGPGSQMPTAAPPTSWTMPMRP